VTGHYTVPQWLTIRQQRAQILTKFVGTF